MNSLQKNLSNEIGESPYESMFAWNEFMTRIIRADLNNNPWIIPLVYGFFKQVKYSVCGKDFMLTLIARRSRHYAGPRYLKRGLNEEGSVANFVEIEQILFNVVPEGETMQISSVVQIRGSIPLFWSQKSKLNIKPKIIVSKKDANYKATKLHFEQLVKRYGRQIVVLNLLKTPQNNHREAALRSEFANALKYLNTHSFINEDNLKFIHWDLSRHSKKSASSAMTALSRLVSQAENFIGIFYGQIPETATPASTSTTHSISWDSIEGKSIPSFQNGVLRTNCIDCLDRTNVAQYIYGLVALGKQLRALSFIESPNIVLNSPLAFSLMKLYEEMGDVVAQQYSGSDAQNKIFCEMRGQWKGATRYKEFIRILQRFYNNAYVDANKQDSINVFLGHFQPHPEKPALWELDSVQRHDPGTVNDWFFIKPSQSDVIILRDCKTSTGTSTENHSIKLSASAPLLGTNEEDNHGEDGDFSNFVDVASPDTDSSILGISSSKMATECQIDRTSSTFETGSCSWGSGSQFSSSRGKVPVPVKFDDWVNRVEFF
ncbi:hypothetical protein ACFE04_004033 [Oxalis oulophora]